MSLAAAAVFARLQDAGFYQSLHRAAAGLLPDGDGLTWLDAGCGPGLLARIAAEKGYRATGIDRDPHMIARARILAKQHGSAAHYRISDLSDVLLAGGYDVVSASSLLVVASDPDETLAGLEALARPGGRVLIIEASSGMGRRRALRAVLSGRMGRRPSMLLAWAAMRAHRTLPRTVLQRAGGNTRCFSLLDGMVHAWLVERPSA